MRVTRQHSRPVALCKGLKGHDSFRVLPGGNHTSIARYGTTGYQLRERSGRSPQEQLIFISRFSAFPWGRLDPTAGLEVVPQVSRKMTARGHASDLTDLADYVRSSGAVAARASGIAT